MFSATQTLLALNKHFVCSCLPAREPPEESGDGGIDNKFYGVINLNILTKIAEIVYALLCIMNYVLWSIVTFLILYQSVYLQNYVYAFVSLIIFAVFSSFQVLKVYRKLKLKTEKPKE